MCSRMISPFRQQRPPNGGFRRVPLLTEAPSYPRVGANTTTRRIRLTRRAVLKTAKQSIGARCRPTSDLKLVGSTRSSRLSGALSRRGAYCPLWSGDRDPLRRTERSERDWDVSVSEQSDRASEAGGQNRCNGGRSSRHAPNTEYGRASARSASGLGDTERLDVRSKLGRAHA